MGVPKTRGTIYTYIYIYINSVVHARVVSKNRGTPIYTKIK